ncbi:MAG: PEP-CTERM sorting domain-containing protein [Planctomycetia bacterium]|nr:PEP-CTERM sorting domain-containing protein [Planctomycetia bacterium]
MASATIGKNATLSANGGALVLPKTYDGTVQATENMTVTLVQNTIRPWAMTFYTGLDSLGGKILPTTPTNQINNFIDYGTAFDMNQVANNVTDAEVGTYMTQHYAAFSYTNLVQVTEDITIDLSGSFDDSQSVSVIQCDENGHITEGAEWVTLLNYGSNCAVNTKTGIDLSAGYYIFDVRVSDNAGSRYANAGVKDKDGNALGIGIRLNGETNYAAFDINPETGVVAGISQMVTGVNHIQDFTFSGKLDIADGKTITFDNPYSDAKTYDIDTTVTGAGTLALTNSGNANATYDVNIDSEGSLSIADAMNVTLAGNIDGDLTLGDNVVLNFELATTDTTPVLTVGGDMNIDANDVVNIFVTGDAPEDGDLTELVLISETGEDSQIEFNPSEMNFSVMDPDLRFMLEVSGNGVYLTLGNSDSLPEPGTWALMIVGLLGMGYIVRKKRA